MNHGRSKRLSARAELLAAVYFLVTSPGMLMLESHIEQELRELV
jgi:hypothetical protein